jgi:carbon-monoxide dehydrogenase large subunit
MNAIIDALSPLGVKHMDMPALPMRVWNAIQDAQGNAAGVRRVRRRARVSRGRHKARGRS